MNHASLFSGIGGFDLAAEWAGWTNVFNCEIDPFCQKVLKYHFPDALQFGDIKQLKFKRDEQGQLWVRRDGIVADTKHDTTGQDGNSDKVSRGRRPVIQAEDKGREGEAFQHKGFDNLQPNEEEETYLPIPSIDIISGGFPCQPFSMAGKRRGTDDDRHLWPEMLRTIREIQPTWIVGENVPGLTNWDGGVVFRQVLSDLENEGYEVQPFIIPACAVNAPHRRDRVWIVAHATSGRKHGISGNDTGTTGTDGLRSNEFDRSGKYGATANGKEQRLQNRNGEPGGDCTHTATERYNGCQNGDAADTEYKRMERKKANGYMERGQRPVISNIKTDGGWSDFPTQPPLRTRNDGISAGLDGITVSKLRNESIKAAGNAIVPQVALQIFKAINEYEKTKL